MKKIIILFTALLLLCSCSNNDSSNKSTSPYFETKPRTVEEQIEGETEVFMLKYLENEIGDLIYDNPKIEFMSRQTIGENKWAILGNATVETKENNIKLVAQFALTVTYDSSDKEFTFSNVKFDDFNAIDK